MVEQLQFKLISKDNIIEDLTSKCHAAEDEVQTLRERLNSCEREKYDVMLNIERYITEIENKDADTKTKKHESVSSRNSSDSGISFDRTNVNSNHVKGISSYNSKTTSAIERPVLSESKVT